MIIDAHQQVIDVSFFERAAVACKSVARLRFGTGFLIARDLVLTAYPILFDDPGAAVRTSSRGVRVLFDYAAAADGSPLATLEREGDLATVVGDPTAQWAAIRLRRPVPRKFPIILLSPAGTIAHGSAAYVVHHPGGGPKKVTISTNGIAEVNAEDFSHAASTTFGSLGAPIFNQQWELVGMHCGIDPRSRVNRAVRVGRILEGLRERHVQVDPAGGLSSEEPVLLYISACDHDLHVAEKLDTYLAPLQRAGKMRVWHRGKVLPGTDMHLAMRQKRVQAAIILILTTAEYLASDECMAEAVDALATAGSRNALVVPILVRPSMWQDTPLRARQCLPQDGQVLLRTPGTEEAYLSVARAIGSLLVDEEI